jgi:hypothetical protein
MNRSHHNQEEVIEEEPSTEEKMLISHMNSEDFYPDDVENEKEESEGKEKFKEDSNEINQKSSKSLNIIKNSEKTPERGNRNLDDSLEMKKEELTFQKKHPVKIRNDKIDIPRREKSVGKIRNPQNTLNISNDRYSGAFYENKNNTDDEEVREDRVILKNNKSAINIQSPNKKKKKEKIITENASGKKDRDRERQRERDREREIETENGLDLQELTEYESKDIDEKDVSLNGNNLNYKL